MSGRQKRGLASGDIQIDRDQYDASPGDRIRPVSDVGPRNIENRTRCALRCARQRSRRRYEPRYTIRSGQGIDKIEAYRWYTYEIEEYGRMDTRRKFPACYSGASCARAQSQAELSRATNNSEKHGRLEVDVFNFFKKPQFTCTRRAQVKDMYGEQVSAHISEDIVNGQNKHGRMPYMAFGPEGLKLPPPGAINKRRIGSTTYPVNTGTFSPVRPPTPLPTLQGSLHAGHVR